MEGLQARAHYPGCFCEHFMFRHWKAKISILHYIPASIPWFTKYSIHILMDRLERQNQTARYWFLQQEMASLALNGYIIFQMGYFGLLGNAHILVYYTIISYTMIEVYRVEKWIWEDSSGTIVSVENEILVH